MAATAGDPAKMTALAGIFCTFPHPKITFFQAFFVELVITAVLMCLIYALVDGRNTAPKGNLGGLLIGLLVALIGGLALARRDEPTADGPEQEPAAPADNRKEVRP